MTWWISLLFVLAVIAGVYEAGTFLLKYLFWTQFGQAPKPELPPHDCAAEYNMRALFPHCDQRVLHAPKTCEYCDHYPDYQELRRVWMINFSGESKLGLSMCPADRARPVGSKSDYNNWSGNVARNPLPKATVQTNG